MSSEKLIKTTTSGGRRSQVKHASGLVLNDEMAIYTNTPPRAPIMDHPSIETMISWIHHHLRATLPDKNLNDRKTIWINSNLITVTTKFFSIKSMDKRFGVLYDVSNLSAPVTERMSSPDEELIVIRALYFKLSAHDTVPNLWLDF